MATFLERPLKQWANPVHRSLSPELSHDNSVRSTQACVQPAEGVLRPMDIGLRIGSPLKANCVWF